jgi:hypothetical protein
MTRKVKELSDMEIDEISLVDRPANQYASVLIAKRDDTQEVTVPEIYDENGEPLADFDALEEGQVVFDANGQAYEVEFNADEDDEPEDDSDDSDESEESDDEAEVSEESEDLVEVGKGFGQMASAFKSGFKNPGLKAPGKGPGFKGSFKAGQNVGNHKMAYGGAAGLATGVAGGAVAQKEFGKSASFADEIRESLSKALGDAERDEVISKAMERVENLSKSLEVAEEIAKSERDLRLTREYVEVAKSYNIPVDPTDLGPVLMRMAEVLDDSDLEVVHKALSSAGSMIFEEVGYIGGGDNVDVMSQVESVIDGAIQKNAEGANISKAEAMADFFAQNPAAYDEYLADKRGF